MNAHAQKLDLRDDELAPDAERQGSAVVKQQPASVQCRFPGAPVQKKEIALSSSSAPAGLPGGLKSGLEHLSGFDLSPVRVHYNSPNPARVGALAYAQGANIHLGPGQERHLPHEGWHVVQQMQGRVRPTVQYKNAPINTDASLEREADTMGGRAHRISIQSPVQNKYPTLQAKSLQTVPPAESSANDAPIQCVLVKLNKARSRGAEDFYSLANTGESGAVDTATMTLEERRKVLADIQKKSNKQYTEAARQIMAEIASITKEADEKEIITISGQLDALLIKHAGAGLDEKDNKMLRHYAFRTLNALDFLGEFDETEKTAERLRVLVLANLDKIQRIDASAISNSMGWAGRNPNLNISAEEIAAYREDIRTGGVWGGGAEAATVAAAFHQYLNIYILDSDGNYVLIDTIGDRAGAQAAFSILNQGNHYVAVDNNHATGDAYNGGHVRHNPAGDGNCMFNALYFALSNADTQVLNDPADGVTALNAVSFCGVARGIAAASLTDPQVALSITEVLVSGQRAGIGPNLRRFIDFRSYDGEKLHSLVGRSKVDEGEIIDALKTAKLVPKGFSGSLSKIIETYSAKNTERPEAAARILSVILDIVYAKLVDADDLIHDKPSERLELALRKAAVEKYRRISSYAVSNSTHNEKQLIIEIKSEEFVLDRIGQLVPRRVVRSISDQNISELRDHHAIYPSKQSPVSYSGGPSGAGVSDNKVKATPEMLHVEGVKPSDYLSTTKQESGTYNPTGESFGSALREIDLAYISPEYIADLSSHRGISYYMLGNYDETSSSTTKALLIAEAEVANQRQLDYRDQERRYAAKESGVKKPVPYGADDKAGENATLSGKEWQALMDVVRTSEILIGCPVPEAAIRQKK